jgi:hypothetical protein
VLDAISKVTDAFWLRFQDGSPKHAWKLHVQFEVDTLCPTAAIELTDARNSSRSDEKHVLRTNLKPGRCYVTDRWFAQFTLFNEIHAAGSSYVCRGKENSAFDASSGSGRSPTRTGPRGSCATRRCAWAQAARPTRGQTTRCAWW